MKEDSITESPIEGKSKSKKIQLTYDDWNHPPCKICKRQGKARQYYFKLLVSWKASMSSLQGVSNIFLDGGTVGGKEPPCLSFIQNDEKEEISNGGLAEDAAYVISEDSAEKKTLENKGESKFESENKSTNDGSRDQPVAPLASGSTTTSNAESNSSVSKVGKELKVATQLQKFTFNELKSATRNFRPESLLGEG
ncbi:hypothetical protein ZIOFF_045854 [Zingiber officinale]|uniref:Uncharacterized protein n=1 Tax=Zingiber officinale TaxID=94328 RepID=A0A8J5KS32_ZINOF|nr:hypothetical protein ZIOFF_045854 [Zingiber officinale]